jgi:hypothetical protein
MKNEKGSSLILGIILGLLVIGSFAVYYFFLNKNTSFNQTVEPKPSFQVVPSTVPEAADKTLDINNFPVYPNAQFIESKDVAPCVEGQYSGFSVCNAKTYTWTADANFDQVDSFYMEDRSNSGWKCSGWKCSGGAGAIEDANNGNIKTSCRSGNLNYDLSINTKDSSSEIILSIPKGSPTGN